MSESRGVGYVTHVSFAKIVTREMSVGKTLSVCTQHSQP